MAPRVSKPPSAKTRGKTPSDVAAGSAQTSVPTPPTVLTPAQEKIGEPRGNLKARAAAFQRRHGKT
jgi:hypothetical protein